MIALCASHVAPNDYTRLEKLRKLLDSVSSQTVQIELYMSVSGLDDKIVKELQARHAPWLHVTKRGCTQMSQFQHYKLLCEEVSERFNSSNTWCMFTDDDDVWHARRAESYLEQIRGSTGSVVVCIDGRMHNGRMLDKPIEYFDYATKLCEFEGFFAIATLDMLRLRGCDLMWRNAILAISSSISFNKPDDVPWLYMQETPKERIDEFYEYLEETRKAWKEYIKLSLMRLGDGAI